MSRQWSWLAGLGLVEPAARQPRRASASVVARLNGDWNEPLDCGPVPLKVLPVYADAVGEERGYALLRFFQHECRRTVTLLRGDDRKERRFSLPTLPCAFPMEIDQAMALTRRELLRLIEHPPVPGIRGQQPALMAPEATVFGLRMDADMQSFGAIMQRYGGQAAPAAPPLLTSEAPAQQESRPAKPTARRSAPAQQQARLEAADSDAREPVPAPVAAPPVVRETQSAPGVMSQDAGESEEWTGRLVFNGWKQRAYGGRPPRNVYLVSLEDEKTGEVIEKAGIHLKELIQEHGIHPGDRIWLKLKEVKRTIDHRTDASGNDVAYTKRTNVYDLKKLPRHG